MEPVDPPADAPDTGPQVCVSFAAEWLPYVLGALKQLPQPAAWNTDDPTVLANVLDNAQRLLQMVGNAEVCMPALELRWSDDACAVQQSTDGGTTWANISGWPTEMPPACLIGATGPAGANGITPELRWNGCTFQVSLDSGATWSDLSGFDIATLQGCLSGTPPNVQGVTTAQNACNIAGWLAADVLQASMAQAATEISAGASLLNAALSILGVAALLTGVGELAIAAAAGFFFSAEAIGASNLNAAASDATLKSQLTCAIYEAIMADGYVTAANFSTVTANIGALSYGTPGIIGLLVDYVSNLGYVGINAIQAEGSLYVGDCSACASPPGWCRSFDFSGDDQLGWTIGSYGEYTSSGGVYYFAGTSYAGYDALNILSPTFAATAITSVEVFYVAPAYTSGARDVRDAAGTVLGDLDTSSGGGTFVTTIPFGETTTQVIIYLTTHAATIGSDQITRVVIRGTGDNPFGASNCD